ncbi:MAG: NAD(P)-dependent oxidoreductase, partial [Actinobacteria bacterium]|nr:NAD(P)-dependent oxidoreductase [Actinomycetota bacterium]NIS36253.1 NAD(P)-dependent oxidoreductase [Actinomycetota bacterium]NIT98610.1 NAD(P)-dependent oxidoreductase [Actinomycetota bacterium]NIU22237.1 NAD(P)-dependent oxidoreductase [Actinomycetota bacterium]NIU70805.1 NAD(P)-dependent oxidoreductase [Actinomycetota bacterium]
EADRDLIHDEAFNVGTTTENYMIRDVAETVADVVPDCEVTLSDEAFNDPRNYRVTCDKLARTIPGFKPQWTVRRGVEQL